MASSGSFTTSKYMNLSIMFEWSVKSQSIDGNSSVIAWSIKGYRTDGAIGMITCGNFTVTINGVTVYSTGEYDRVDVKNGTVVESGETTISHDSDGAKTFSAYVSAAIYERKVNSTGTQQFALPTIPRKSSLSASNGTLGTAQTLTVDKKSSSFTHTITYVCGKASGTVCTKSRNTSITWTPPLELASQNTTGTSVSIKFTITTYNGNADIGLDTKTISCTIPASVKPSCSLAISDPTGFASEYGGYIKGLSKLEVIVTAESSYGSDIASYSTTANGTRYTKATFTTDVLKTAGSQSVVATVTDKRGRSGSDTETITVLNYTAPAVTSLSVRRCNADGTANDQGEYVKVTFSGKVTALGDKNIARYTVEYKKTTSSNYASETLTDYNDNFTVSNVNYIFPADSGSSYDVRVTIVDALTSSSKNTSASTGFTLMHWKADGTAVGIGKVAEKSYALDMGVSIELNDNDIYKNGLKPFAPAGYGLGTDAVIVDNWDNAVANGFYTSNKGGPTSGWFYGFVHSYDSTGKWVIQKVWQNDGGGGGFCSAERRCAGGTWGEWEWVQPPMVLGVEYRTTERHNGAVVYAVRLTVGELLNKGTTTTSLPSTPTEIVELYGTAKSDAYTETVTFPILTSAGAVGARLSKEATRSITVRTFADYSGYIATATVKYTKG